MTPARMAYVLESTLAQLPEFSDAMRKQLGLQAIRQFIARYPLAGCVVHMPTTLGPIQVIIAVGRH